MNLAQLELRRLRSLLAGVRRARHLAQAMRQPLAKYLSFERRAQRAWNRPLEQLQLVKEYGSFEPFEPSPKERIDALDEFAKQLAGDEKAVTRAIEKLEGSKRLTAPSLPIEERIAKRKKKTKAEAKKAEKKRAAWEAFQKRADAAYERWAAHPYATLVNDSLMRIRRMIRANTLFDIAQDLALVRHRAGNDLGDEIKRTIEEAKALSNS